MPGEPGRAIEEAEAACKIMGLNLREMAFKRWTIKVVDVVETRVEPNGAGEQPPPTTKK
jgi:hypothetical protein